MSLLSSAQRALYLRGRGQRSTILTGSGRPAADPASIDEAPADALADRQPAAETIDDPEALAPDQEGDAGG